MFVDTAMVIEGVVSIERKKGQLGDEILVEQKKTESTHTPCAL